jgi:hypothetical protein
MVASKRASGRVYSKVFNEISSSFFDWTKIMIKGHTEKQVDK